jgi:hypothetical protein
MRKSRLRLLVAAVLFAAWLGYLAYLAATTTQPTVLSRPQFLVADLYVIAEIPADPAAAGQPTNVVTVKKLVWSADSGDARRTKLRVENLNHLEPRYGWHGPDEYILALSRSKTDAEVFQVTPLPRTPGFRATDNQSRPLYRIYPATPTTLRELEQIKDEYHP